MKTTFWVAALFTIVFNLQSTALAADASNSAEVTATEATATEATATEATATEDAQVDDSAYEDDTKIDPDAPADPPGEELYDPHMHAEAKPTEGQEDETADVNEHEPGTPEYLKYMEELSRAANEETKQHEEAKKREAKKGEKSEENDSGLSPKTAVVEEGMDVQIDEEEEIVLPSIHPEINAEMTHVSYVNEKDAREVHMTVEYSFFKGADQYELCINCDVDKDGKRENAESVGKVKSFSKGDDHFCELPPACFAEFIWKVGVHTFSMRAHTVKGWTIWSPTYHFDIPSEVGIAVHLPHNEL